MARKTDVTMYEYDCVVIGSGFGGSVGALRSAEKGHRTLILEQGSRFKDDDFAKSNWDLRAFLWAPIVNFLGPCQLLFTREFMSISGVGVGGGSLIYANTHRIPNRKTLETGAWLHSNEHWFESLEPFYQQASKMLGVNQNPRLSPSDLYLKKVAQRLDCESSFVSVDCGVVFPEMHNVSDPYKSVEIGDPYFDGQGPKRNTCNYCGNCMVGCRNNAKNTLEKNYLFFAEKAGVEIRPLSKVVSISLIDNVDDSKGYRITVEERKRYGQKRIYHIITQSVILSAGSLGSVPLLLQLRESGTMPNISSRVGHQVMTNSETLVTVTKFKDTALVNHSIGVAISSEIQVDDETRIQVVRYGEHNDAAWLMAPSVPLTDKQKGRGRWKVLLGYSCRHPIKTLRLLNPRNKAIKSIWLLVMQSKPAFLTLKIHRPWYFFFLRKRYRIILDSQKKRSDNYFPIAQTVAKHFADVMEGEPANLLSEVVLGIPVTGHVMGGAVMGSCALNGVVDHEGNLFGYKNFKVLDGSIIPSNLGVNPSLTILALAERAMSRFSLK